MTGLTPDLATIPDTARSVLRQRLSTQRLVGPGLPTATEVVSLLTCVQSQEYAHGFWSLGMRSRGLTYDDVRQEFDAGLFVRTHVLRPTWHFMAAADVRWILALTSPRVQQTNRGRYRQLGLSQADLDRGSELLVGALTGGNYLTRRELGDVLESGGLSKEGQRLAHLVMNAELEALICSGPMRGAQHTYAVLDERIPAVLDERIPAGGGLAGADALERLTWRFFSGHGPASVKDFTRWSSLTTADAVAGIERAGDRLESVQVAGQTLWFDPTASEVADDVGGALLVPLYDEVTLSYPQLSFPLAPGHPHPPGVDLFVGSVLVDAVNVGTWRRTVRGQQVAIEVDLAPASSSGARVAVSDAAARLARFLGRELAG